VAAEAGFVDCSFGLRMEKDDTVEGNACVGEDTGPRLIVLRAVFFRAVSKAMVAFAT
jgi:hypothetical protein